MTVVYRKEAGEPRYLEGAERIPHGRVVRTPDGHLFFRCPCDDRDVFVTQPPHTASYDEAGRLTLDGSCGSYQNGDLPENWCHFSIKGGMVEIHSDSVCPGKDIG